MSKTIRIQYLSDIHLEFYPDLSTLPLFNSIKLDNNNSDDTNPTILILAGDIGDPYNELYKEFLGYCSQKFDKVFIIAGNHEYYNHYSIFYTNKRIAYVCSKFNNVTYLYNNYEDYNGVRFIGTPLFSDSRTEQVHNVNNNFLSFLDYDTFYAMHRICLHFVEEILAISEDIPCVMITHYVPSLRVMRNIKGLGFYASDLEYLIKAPVKAWIFGHTHDIINKRLNNVQLKCNPIGYPDGIDSKVETDVKFPRTIESLETCIDIVIPNF